MSDEMLSVEAAMQLFTRKSGDYNFARWGRPIAPVVFGCLLYTSPSPRD